MKSLILLIAIFVSAPTANYLADCDCARVWPGPGGTFSRSAAGDTYAVQVTGTVAPVPGNSGTDGMCIEPGCDGPLNCIFKYTVSFSVTASSAIDSASVGDPNSGGTIGTGNGPFTINVPGTKLNADNACEQQNKKRFKIYVRVAATGQWVFAGNIRFAFKCLPCPAEGPQ
jgi:hypothetical protein